MIEAALWREMEDPFREELLKLDHETQGQIGLALRCIGLRSIAHAMEKENAFENEQLLLRVICSTGSASAGEMRDALVVLHGLCEQVRPWLGRAENIKRSRTVQWVERVVGNLLEVTSLGSKPRGLHETLPFSEVDKKLSGLVKLAGQAFEPEYVQLLEEALNR